MEASDAARGGLNLPLKDILAGLDSRWQELESIHQQAVALLHRRGHWDDFPKAPPTGVILEKHPGRRFCHALEQAQAAVPRPLEAVSAASCFRGSGRGRFCFCLWAVAAGPSIAVFGWQRLAVGGHQRRLRRAGRRRSPASGSTTLPSGDRSRPIWPCGRRCSRPGWDIPAVLEAAKAECQRLDATIIARHKTQIQKADETHAAAMASIEQRKQDDLQQAESTYPKRLADLAAWRDRTLKEIEEKYPALLRQIEEHYRTESERLRARHDQRTGGEPAAIRARVDRDGRAVADGHGAVSRVGRGDRRAPAARRFPIGTRTTGAAGRRRRRFRRSFRFGGSQIKLAEIRRRRARGRAASAGAGSISRCRCCCPFRGVRCCC